MRVPGPLTAHRFASLPSSVPLSEAGGAGGSSLLDSLKAQDAGLRRLHNGEWPAAEPPQFVRVLSERRPAGAPADVAVDVAVCGGTLGLLLACALQLRGHRVAVLEAGPLRGRAQDWNTSEDELLQLVREGVLDASELAAVAPLHFGPMSCRFGPAPTFELKLRGVLDVGVSPEALLRCVRARFEAAGGVVLERTAVRAAAIHPDGAALTLAPAGDADGGGAAATPRTLHSRLVVDCMGHRSPIALQQRRGQRPDGVCVQVGSCARGAWATRAGAQGDFFVTADDAERRGPRRCARVQYFWQAFPSSGGADERSTYLFSYLRPGREMPSLLEVMEDYWRELPQYQAVGGGGGEEEVAAERIVFGWFPIYRRGAPLPPAYDRVLSVGDAAGAQSPISFGRRAQWHASAPRARQAPPEGREAPRLSPRAALGAVAGGRQGRAGRGRVGGGAGRRGEAAPCAAQVASARCCATCRATRAASTARCGPTRCKPATCASSRPTCPTWARRGSRPPR